MSVVIRIAVSAGRLLALVRARLPERGHPQRGAGYADPNQYDTRLSAPPTSTATSSAWGGGWSGGASGC